MHLDPDSLRPEESFLISCIANTITGKKKGDSKIKLSFLNWEYVYELALFHRIMPAVQFFFQHDNSPGIPISVKRHFNSTFLAVSFSNFSLTKQLLTILRLLGDQGIDLIPLKGPMLAQMAYGNIGRREFSDIDIFIRKSDLQEVVEAIKSAGFITASNGEKPGISFENELELCLKIHGGFCKLDIHWHLVEEYYGLEYPFDDVFARCVQKELLNTKIHSLCPEDMFLSIIMHHGKEGWRELRYVADVAGLLIREAGLNWVFLTSKCKEMGLEQYLNLGIFLTKCLFTIEIPETLWRSISDDAACINRGKLTLERYFSDLKGYTPGDIKFDFSIQQELNPRLNSYFFFKDIWRDFVRPNSLDREGITLPRALYFVYYFKRFFRLVKTYGLKKIFNTAIRLIELALRTIIKNIFGSNIMTN